MRVAVKLLRLDAVLDEREFNVGKVQISLFLDLAAEGFEGSFAELGFPAGDAPEIGPFAGAYHPDSPGPPGLGFRAIGARGSREVRPNVRQSDRAGWRAIGPAPGSRSTPRRRKFRRAGRFRCRVACRRRTSFPPAKAGFPKEPRGSSPVCSRRPDRAA